MKNKNLVFLPTGLNSPENEVLCASIQSLLDKKKDVTILTCSGGKNYSCSKNIFSFSQICKLCKFKTKQNIKKIKDISCSLYKEIYLLILLNYKNNININDQNRIFNYCIKKK